MRHSFTPDEIRIIRKGLLLLPTDIGVRALLRTEFPEPAAPKEQPRETTVPDIFPEEETDNQHDAHWKVHDGGYLVFARRRFPYNFYPVFWTEDISQANLFMEQLVNDAQLRFTSIRDAKDLREMVKPVRQKRQPREKFQWDETEVIIEGPTAKESM